MGLEALAGHLVPEDAALRAAVREGADALVAAVAKIGKVVLTAPADGKARPQRGVVPRGCPARASRRTSRAVRRRAGRGAAHAATPPSQSLWANVDPHIGAVGSPMPQRRLAGASVPGAARLGLPPEPAPPRRGRRRARRTRPARSR